MIEFRWHGNDLQYRERSFQVDASGAFCGVTDFGPWTDIPKTVGPSGESPSDGVRDVVAKYSNSSGHD